MDFSTQLSGFDFVLVTRYCSIMFALSCLGTIIVFYRTYKQWKFIKSAGEFKMTYKLPFYTSCIGN